MVLLLVWSCMYTVPDNTLGSPGAHSGMASSTDHVMYDPLTSMCSTGPAVASDVCITTCPVVKFHTLIVGSTPPVKSFISPPISASEMVFMGRVEAGTQAKALTTCAN